MQDRHCSKEWNWPDFQVARARRAVQVVMLPTASLHLRHGCASVSSYLGHHDLPPSNMLALVIGIIAWVCAKLYTASDCIRIQCTQEWLNLRCPRNE